MECSLECAAAEVEDELIPDGNLRSGLKGVLPARGIGSGTQILSKFKAIVVHQSTVQSAIPVIDLIEFVKIRVSGLVLKFRSLY